MIGYYTKARRIMCDKELP